MKRKFCCDASRDLYETYYVKQSGMGVPVFAGSRGQRGHGIGSVLGGLFRSAVPLLKRGLANFGRHALRTGLDIANDVVEGGNFKESAQRRAVSGLKDFARDSIKDLSSSEFLSNQSGSGRRRIGKRKASKRKASKGKASKGGRRSAKRRKIDIFD